MSAGSQTTRHRDEVPIDWTREPERSNAFALRVMSWIALHGGRRMARWLLHPITLYFLLFAAGPRRQSRRYLGRVLGRPARLSDAYRQVHGFASTILDRVYFLGGRMDLFDVQVHGESLIDATLADGRGAFLVGAHLGSFEALHVVGRTRPALRIAMVMYPDNARLINSALAAVAPDFRADIIALGRMDSMLAIRDWLDAGGLAGMLADRSRPAPDDKWETGPGSADLEKLCAPICVYSLPAAYGTRASTVIAATKQHVHYLEHSLRDPQSEQWQDASFEFDIVQ